MRHAPLSFILCLATAILMGSCSDKRTPDYNPDIGPFDEDGNYIEAWADNPPRRKPNSYKKPAPENKASEETEKSGGFFAGLFGSKKKEDPKVVRSETPKRRLYDPPKETPERRLYDPPKEPRPAPKVASTPKPKPKPPAVKPKPKPTPKPVKVTPSYRNHTVAKGDTLYGLSRKYGVSVSAIQKANGLSGTNIRQGATLKIPRK